MEAENNKELVSYCGLYCGSCKKFVSGKCSGCFNNEKATWCKIRTCCIENNYSSCADCKEFDNIMECKKFNNFFSKIMTFIFKSDRYSSIGFIKQHGYEEYAKEMSEKKQMSIKK